MLSQRFIKKHLYQRSLVSYLLYPLGLIFACLQRIRRVIYATIPGLSYRSSCHIISIGNITSGGSGKTPLTIFLAEYLTSKGRKVAVSHRDYGGNYETSNKLISDREAVFSYAEYAGDEACLLALKLPGIPVITGKDRKSSIEILLRKFSDLDHIILDDSFQHLKVKHDLDVVVINSTGGLGNGFVLPAGILREPVSTLKKADLIVYNSGNSLPDFLQRYREKVINGRYLLKGIYDLEHKAQKLSSLKGKTIALLSGIGNPDSFEATVKETGLGFLQHYKYPDHFHYEQKDLDRLKQEADVKEIDVFLTTEKDSVKLNKLKHQGLNILVLSIQLQLGDEGLLQSI